MPDTIKTILKTKKGKYGLLSIILLAAFVIGFTAYSKSRNSLSNSNIIKAEKGDVLEKVEVSGLVKPAREVELSFSESGRISGVNVKVGDRVSAGAVLVSIENGDTRAELTQAEVALQSETIKYEQLLRANTLNHGKDPANGGTEEVAVLNARAKFVESLTEGYKKADSVVSAYVDQFFSQPRTNPEFGIKISDSGTTYFIQGSSELRIRINNEKEELNDSLLQWKASLETIQPDSFEDVTKTANATITKINDLLQDIGTVLNSSTPASSAEESIYSGYKDDLYTVQTAISAITSTITTASQATLSSQSEVTADELKLRELSVQDAEAKVKSIESDLAKTLITAPFSGIVTSVDAKVGQIASSNTSLVKIISEGQFEIEAFIPESDISKITVGNEGNITLDAYGSDEQFPAKVSKIDPSETVKDGVSTYKITLQFEKPDARIRSGMTANIEIETAERLNVIKIPERAITVKGDEKFVTVPLPDNTTKEVAVTTGLRGSDGFIEVLSGLNEGDGVVTSISK